MHNGYSGDKGCIISLHKPNTSRSFCWYVLRTIIFWIRNIYMHVAFEEASLDLLGLLGFFLNIVLI